MIELEKRDDVTPICPHCVQALPRIWFRQLSGFFGKRYVYMCPHCRKVLGVSHRKGFWMG